ncbi:MAG: PDZ domain-containing protein [Acidobacteria bacterium]|nr:PDZ domain-containing protein [Acidobacteriota bacterium]
MRLCRHALLVVILVLVAAPSGAQSQACTPLGQATFVRDTLQELYYWYRELPDADPARFQSPEAYLDAVRFRPVDASFSYITSRAADDAFYSGSQFTGLGFSTAVVDGQLRVLQVFEGSPADESGLDRGSRIETIDELRVSDLIADGRLDGAFGPAEIGREVALTFVTRDGERRSASPSKRSVTIPTVSLTRVFDVGSRRVGYLFFRNFVWPSMAALDQAFTALETAGVDELVLDLRYNGGGLVEVARYLATLVGGASLRDQVFAESRHNDRNRRLNSTLRFGGPSSALRLDRLVVITTRASASASELLINGLTPFLPVVVVGDRTYGKPVGQYGLSFCDKVLAPVAFSMVNARGEGGYFDGLPADCEAADDIGHELGRPEEASLAAALGYIATGQCPPPSAPRLGKSRAAAAGVRPGGWRALINAQ